MYKVVVDIKLKVQGIVKAFPTGSVIKLPETAARMFLQHGKIVPVFEPVDDLNERMAIQGENTAPEQSTPYVTNYGTLVIPWNSPRKYHYWDSGQSVCDTLRELGRCDLINKYKSIYSN